MIEMTEDSEYANLLAGAVHGEVVTRLSLALAEYLHIGHVMSAILNFHCARTLGGKMILRIKDGSSSADKLNLLDNIFRDLTTLEIFPHQVTFESEYLEMIEAYAW